jgi:hypothetical protein
MNFNRGLPWTSLTSTVCSGQPFEKVVLKKLQCAMLFPSTWFRFNCFLLNVGQVCGANQDKSYSPQEQFWQGTARPTNQHKYWSAHQSRQTHCLKWRNIKCDETFTPGPKRQQKFRPIKCQQLKIMRVGLDVVQTSGLWPVYLWPRYSRSLFVCLWSSFWWGKYPRFVTSVTQKMGRGAAVDGRWQTYRNIVQVPVFREALLKSGTLGRQLLLTSSA